MEDIDDDFVSSEHDRLISAISKLDKTQHITEPTRNEPSNLSSEFNLIKRSNKLNLSNVAKVLKDTSHHVQIGKKLKKTQDVSKILPKPLEKPQAERIKRATGYEGAKKKIGRWDPIVARSRTVDFVSFPLKNIAGKPKNRQPTKEFLSRFVLKSPLEKELEEIDPPTIEVEEDEQEQTYPMSYDEMVEHRQHLAKIRAQQSYKAAKAKRQSKIKSKKFHRILKKEKLKTQLKEFEELQKKDPEEALKKLEALEKARALERHTLRHKNTGKWAKNKLVRAKYDKEVRQQLAEQLSVSRGLTHKAAANDSTDDEADTNEAIPDITLSQDPMNPWMMKRSDKSNIDSEFDFGYKKYLKEKMFKNQDESDNEDTEQDNNDDNKTANGELDILKENVKKVCEEQILDECNGKETKQDDKKQCSDNSVTNKRKRKLVATSNWIVEPVDGGKSNNNQNKPSEDIITAFNSFENNLAEQIEMKLKKIRGSIEKLEKRSKPMGNTQKHEKEIDNLEYLKLKNQKIKPIIDEELIETDTKTIKHDNDSKPLSAILKTDQISAVESIDSNIDPGRFIEVKSKYLNTALPQGENGLDQLDDDEQIVPRVNIEEVFEEDDVVASFRQEKEDEINKDKPDDIDLSLPGWGSWGGKGVKAPKRKKNRFILKAPPKVPRRDDNKGDIIIKEFKDPKLSAHKVSDVPFPFTSVKEYEASIRAPLGNTFIPEKAHKLLIKPSVITKAGTIIEPMNEEELLAPINRTFKNGAFIKLLDKK